MDLSALYFVQKDCDIYYLNDTLGLSKLVFRRVFTKQILLPYF